MFGRIGGKSNVSKELEIQTLYKKKRDQNSYVRKRK